MFNTPQLGGSLSDHLARHALCEDHARYFFKQLLAALAFCHSRKIVYRDIKPANVLITGTQPPFLKLCDFGLVSVSVLASVSVSGVGSREWLGRCQQADCNGAVQMQ